MTCSSMNEIQLTFDFFLPSIGNLHLIHMGFFLFIEDNIFLFATTSAHQIGIMLFPFQTVAHRSQTKNLNRGFTTEKFLTNLLPSIPLNDGLANPLSKLFGVEGRFPSQASFTSNMDRTGSTATW